MIFKLILKDFRASWRYVLISISAAYLLLMVVLTMMLDDGGSIFAGVYMIVVLMSCMSLSLLFIKVDDVFNANQIYASLPVHRSAIVIARYITSIFLIILGLLVAILAFSPAQYFQQSFNDPVLQYIYQPEIWIALFVALIILVSFTFPFYFRFGLGRGIVALIIFQFSVLILGYAAYQLDPFNLFITNGMNHLVAFISNQTDLLLLMEGLILTLLFLTGSIWLSCTFYNHLDL